MQSLILLSPVTHSAVLYHHICDHILCYMSYDTFHESLKHSITQDLNKLTVVTAQTSTGDDGVPSKYFSEIYSQ